VELRVLPQPAPASATAGPGAELLTGAYHDWLATRVGCFDGVVFSGGEPLAQPGLADAMAEVRALGLARRLHTNGRRPRALG